MSQFKSYWFLNGNLHKIVKFRYADELVETFDFVDKKYKTYYRSVWDSTKEPAYTLADMAEWFGRSRRTIEAWTWRFKLIPRGTKAWSLDNPDYEVAEFWTKDQVWECWEVAKSMSDSPHWSKVLLSRQEMRAILNEDTLVYVKKDGELVPVFREIL